MSRVRGTFDEFSGQIVTAADPTQSTVTAVIELSSVSTGLAIRDNHLLSSEFFDAEQTPKLTFISTALRQAGDRRVLDGDLTINGITKAVELEADYLGIDPASASAVSPTGARSWSATRST